MPFADLRSTTAPASLWPHRRFRLATGNRGLDASVDRRVYVVLGAFLSVYLLLNAIPPNSFISDDTDQLIFSQRLALGYHEQPPLYSWIVWLTFRAFGVSRIAYACAKTLILALLFVVYARTARLVIDDPRGARLAALCPALIPVFFWNAIAYLTHTNLACLFTLMTFASLVRIERLGRTRDYMSLGVAIGLGVLSKYNAPVFAAALVAAGLGIKSYRSRLLERRLLLSLAIAGLIAAPHLWWLRSHWEAVMHSGAWKAKLTATGSPLAQSGKGVMQLCFNLGLSLLPLLATFALVFPRAYRPSSSDRVQASPARALLGRCFSVTVLLVLLLILCARTAHVHERWMQPLVLLAPLFLFARLGSIAAEQRRAAVFAGILTVFGLASTLSYAAQAIGNYHRFGEYGQRMSFAAAAAHLDSALEPDAIVIAEDRVVCANLRYHLPDRRHICVPHGRFESAVGAGVPCYLVWNVSHGRRQPPPLAQSYAGRSLNRRILPDVPLRFAEVYERDTGKPVARLAYARLVPRY